MIDQQPDVELGAGELGDSAACRGLRGSRRARSRRRRCVGLAALARRLARAGHQLRRHAHDPLAAREQEALQRARTRAGSPRSPTPAPAAEPARPQQQIIKRPAPGPHGHVSEHPAGRRVDRRQRVRALVGVRPEHDHLHRPFVGIPNERIAGGHISVGAMPRSYQVTPGSSDGGGRHNHRQSGPTARHQAYESARRRTEDLPVEPDATARPDHSLTEIQA